MTPNLKQSFEMAVQHHRAGRLTEAEALYRQILSIAPDHADSLHMLGVLAGQGTDPDAGIEMIRRAIAARPGQAVFHLNLGEIYRRTGKHELAAAAYAEAARLQPKSAMAHYCLGLELRELGRLPEAVASYQQAIRLNPNFADAYGHLAIAAMQLGRIEQAIEAQQALVRLRPASADAWSNLGTALAEAGRTAEAIEADRRAISLSPGHASARNNLAAALAADGQYRQALVECREALRLQPELPEAHNNLGSILTAMGELDEAADAFRTAIAISPNHASAHFNLAGYRRVAIEGNVLKDQGRLDEAIAAYRQAICLKSDFPEAHSNLLYALHFHPGFDSRQILAESREWSRRFADALSAGAAAHDNDRSPGRRLRIGYVSPDFRRHPVGRFLAPVLAHHDRGQFEVFCYSGVRRPDNLTDRLRRDADHWRQTTGSSDHALAEQVRHDRIDLLVDLTMHMTENRLLTFARRPAPVQVTWLAYAGTTGLKAIDYRLSDPYLDPLDAAGRQVPPDGAQPHDDGEYAEQTIRLPRCYWCYEPAGPTPDVSPLPALEAGHVTFGCFNNFCKVTAPTLQLWARLLHAVPRSRLLIHGNPGAYQQGVRRVFSEAGVLSERLEFIAFQPVEEYLRQHHRVDIALDPFPYGGGTTTCDSLWMGVPVVTLTGRTAVGRSGVSLLSNLGLTELIAATPEQYLAIAAAQAADLPSLARLRAGLRPRMRASALMDGPAFTAGLEAAFREMWRRWCAL